MAVMACVAPATAVAAASPAAAVVVCACHTAEDKTACAFCAVLKPACAGRYLKNASCFAFMWAGFRLNSFIHSGFAFRPPCTQTRVARRHLSTSAARTAAAPQATQERRFSSARNDFAVRAAVAHARDTARACRLACAIGHGRRARHLDSGSRATSRSRAHQRKWRSRTHTSFSVFDSNNTNTNKN